MKNLFVSLGICFFAIVSLFAQEKAKELESEESAEKRWPRFIRVSNADITVFQPQLESFDNNVLTSRAAVSVKRDKNEKTDYCAIWMKADVDTDKEARTVKLRDMKVTKIAFPEASEKAKESLGSIIRKNILKADLTISLDRLLAMLDVVDKQHESNQELDDQAPEFIFSKEASVLVNIDGEPVLIDLGNGVSKVANTRFLIALDSTDKKYYLKCAGRWFSAEKILGPWITVPKVPEKIAALDKKSEESEKSEDDEVVPKIFVATKPTELIQCFGEPELVGIPGTDLTYLKNSDSDAFRDIADSKLYILVSGRWFSADQKEGPWTYVASDKLPKDFTKIPANSPKADVLASVAGTQEAKDALMESFIPQTASIKRGAASLDIVYDGEPEFKVIEGTEMSYAVNTQTPVVKLIDKYYACDNGAWYVSNSPKGPWEVCVKIPQDIYSIPPSCPIYNATFVKVYDYNDDYADVGYTSGYYNSYPYGGVVVFGTGYRYRPWWRRHWWPRRPTYGWRFRYDHHNGRWHRYDRYRGRHGKYVAWNNNHNLKRRSLPARGHGNYRRKQATVRYNRNAYTYNKGAVKAKSRQRVAAKTTSNRVKTVSNRATTKTSNRTKTSRRKKVSNNVYAGSDGKVYRHGLNGWQKHSNGKWKSTKQTRKAAKSKTVTRTRQKTKAVSRPKVKPTTSSVRKTVKSTPHKDLKKHYRSRQRGNHRVTRQRNTTRTRNVSRSRSSSRGRSSGGGRRR